MRPKALYLTFSCMLLVGCSSLLNQGRDIQLAKAEPLFGRDFDHCLDNPQVLFAMLNDSDTRGGVAMPEECKDIVEMIVNTKATSLSFNDIPNLGASSVKYTMWRRNEIVDALVAVSNRKCGDYSAHLKTFDGQSNSSLSVLSILTGGIGGLVNGEQAARILSGSSAIISGSRAALNEAWFSNQTMHVLVSGFEKVREREARELNNRQACPIQEYTLMDGIGDAMRYHSSCSLLSGLSEAAEAIDRADQPGLDTMRRTLSDLQAIRKQSRNLVEDEYRRNERALSQFETALDKADADIEANGKEIAGLEAEIGAAESAQPPGNTTQMKANLVQAKSKAARLQVKYDKALVAYNGAQANEDRKEENFRKTSGEIVGTKSSKAICPFS